jgi:hypothetical protein
MASKGDSNSQARLKSKRGKSSWRFAKKKPTESPDFQRSLQSTSQQPSTSPTKEEETQPADLALAKRRLDEVAERLKKQIPKDFLGATTFEVQGCADVTSLADQIGKAIMETMKSQEVRKETQGPVQALMIDWAKKTIPFVQQRLSLTNVFLQILNCELNAAECDPCSVQLDCVRSVICHSGIPVIKSSHFTDRTIDDNGGRSSG